MSDAPFRDQQAEIVYSKSIHIPPKYTNVAKFTGVLSTPRYFLNTSAEYFWSAKAYQRLVHWLLNYLSGNN